MTSGFDRLRPRSPYRAQERAVTSSRDTEGTRVLFSGATPARTMGRVSIDCSSCRRVTSVSLLSAARLALPSLHLPLVRRGHWSWMRCPSCGRRTWMRLQLLI